MKKLNKKGNTLIELVISIALMSVILISIVRLLVDLNNTNTNTKTETTKETNSSQTVANNVNTNAQTVAIKETNKELSEIKILMGQFMSKLSEIIDKNNNSIEMARAVEIGFESVCRKVIPVRVEELPPDFTGNGMLGSAYGQKK